LVCFINCAGNLHEEDYSTESQCDKILQAINKRVTKNTKKVITKMMSH